MPDQKFKFEAYRGDEPFIFVSYSHQDSDVVFKEMHWIRESGFNLWFDEGIVPGSRWSDELAAAIERCSLFLYFITPNSASSEHCRNEVQFASSREKPFLAVHLIDTQLPPGLELSVANTQAIIRSKFDTESYRDRLLEAITNLAQTSLAPSSQTLARAPQKPRIRQIIAAVAALTLVSIALVGYLSQNEEETKPASVVVLPFDNYLDSTDAYLANGIAEALIGQLGRAAHLRVVSRASSFSLKNELANGTLRVSEIPDRVGAQYVVEGSILTGNEDTEMQIAVRVVDSMTDTNMWTREWLTNKNGLVNIQVEMATAISSALGVNVDAAERPPALTTVPMAYDPYLRGMEYLRNPTNFQNSEAAKVSFNEAVSLDPNFPQAYAGLCQAYLDQYMMDRDSLPFALAQRACNKALSLDDQLWEVNLSLARLYRYSGDYVAAHQATRVALDNQPDKAEVHSSLAAVLEREGKFSDAEAAYLRAIELDPGYWRVYMDLGSFYYDRAQYEKALEVYTTVMDMTPDTTNVLHAIATVQLAKGDFDESLTNYQRVRAQQATPRRSTTTNIGTAYYYKGCFAESAYWQRAAFDLSPSDHRAVGRLAESCRYVAGYEASAHEWWGKAIELARRQHNQADWATKGLVAIYHAHRGEMEQAQQNLDDMWALTPEPSIGHFYAAVVAKSKGQDELRLRETKSALAAGIPQAMVDYDPDLGVPLECTEGMKITTAPCELP